MNRRTERAQAENETYIYIEELRAGKHGDLGRAFLRQFFPDGGPMKYTLGEREACCERIRSALRHPEKWEINHLGEAVYARRPISKAESDRIDEELFGPRPASHLMSERTTH